jgi:hypothetical protein
MKEIWIECEEEAKGNFYDENDRDPTEEELEELMKTAWPDYMGGLIDHAKIIRKYA